MAKRRIPTKPNELRDQMMQAATGIGGEANWPSTAPTAAEVNTVIGSLFAAITQVNDLKSQLAQARANLHTKRDQGVDVLERVDEVTDGLYGAGGAEKNNFGLPPKKTTHGESEPLDQIVITKVEDGISPASIAVDWDSESGAAAYQIEWYTAA